MAACRCGSGCESWWLHDARGIPVSKVCTACISTVKKKYRPEIFTDSHYEVDESIEPEDY